MSEQRNVERPPDRPAERHWADAVAAEVQARGLAHPVVATGISPSGEFHVGHLREILSGDSIARAIRGRGVPVTLKFIVDDVDPLRKVSPFLDAAVYAPLVGRSLFELPAPGGGGTYADHYLNPFLEALGALRVEVEVVRAHEMYRSGAMDDVVFTSLERRDDIARILAEVTGKEVEDNWSPWNPRCSSCGKITSGVVRDFDRAAGTIRSHCGHCGARTEQSPAGGGKLTWRVDWAARWKVLGVSAEPFGKDHASRGGSYDTGVLLARGIFGIEPPVPLVYEWISLKGQGDMSSSKGNVLSVHELLRMVPPEVLRYLVLKHRPARSIAFDPGLPLLKLVDEVDDASATGRDDRSLELSRAAGFRPVGVPFHHLVLVTQIARFDLDRTISLLERGGYAVADRGAIAERIEMAKVWLAKYAPDEVKVEVPDELPEAARALSPEQKAFLHRLADALPGLPTGDAIQSAIRELAATEGGPGAAAGFAAVYAALLGRSRGPRAGQFIEILGRERVAARLREV